ncbi:HAMP domain-containing sensor histidine kinase [Bosea sp. (in: a-proteobacteria)]|uniref:sensor histidine kinase n=1 Tax=Bosea sp. (in: a-proteobacteria) TaxID=1871050 RepID=UPI002619A986|nr:HAMP domain-containing sensor histidine kinase [Bosea sp. (in: a-proteobacteria)]MCO5092566.1 HAMP domain-containing histidine kinase [Bosea sp. (in: a-proteobacteria)]
MTTPADPLPRKRQKFLPTLFRTTAFKLTAAYLVIFALFAAFVLGYVSWNARRLLTDQIRSTIDAEIRGLAEQQRQGGIRRLVNIIERRSRAPGASLYLVTTPVGERIAGNVEAIPPGTLDRTGESEIEYARSSEAMDTPGRALVRVFILPAGFRLLVGRDLEERERLGIVIRRAAGWSLALVFVLGCFASWFVARRVLKRIDGMSETAHAIMAGDLEGRIAITGTGDELDRLALNLNAMLDRIGELMAGMQQVTDNIAHDLKTPLTRLRNRAEEALRTAKSPDELRAALDGAIEEADNLIRVFNALLMIARLEAGRVSDNMSELDISEIVSGLAELYEPLAEEAGLSLASDVAPGLKIRGNRELIGQALNNLIDNALKYGGPEQGGDGTVTVVARQAGDRVALSVADHGPGIPEADRGRVCDRFVRLDASRSKPGFGLGLSLAAGVVRLHGGELRLEDNAPGLRVVILLPASGPKPVDTPVLAEPAASTQAPNPAGVSSH